MTSTRQGYSSYVERASNASLQRELLRRTWLELDWTKKLQAKYVDRVNKARLSSAIKIQTSTQWDLHVQLYPCRKTTSLPFLRGVKRGKRFPEEGFVLGSCRLFVIRSQTRVGVSGKSVSQTKSS